MFFYEGCVCPVCSDKFKDSDDVVACPDCGAPHHRECWNKEGHCHFEKDHGTANQWRRPAEPTPAPEQSVQPSLGTPQAPPKTSHPSTNSNQQSYIPPSVGSYPEQTQQNATKKCPNCGTMNPQFAEYCSKCGTDLGAEDWHSTSETGKPVEPTPSNQYPPYSQSQFGGYGEFVPVHAPQQDPYGGLPRNEKIDDATVDELATVVGQSANYYLPKFNNMDKTGSKASWNWAAFFLTPYWLFYRKNYIPAGIVLTIKTVLSMLRTYILYAFLDPVTKNPSLMFDEKYRTYTLIIMLCQLIMVVINLIFGIIGNYVYFKNSLKRIRKIRKENPDVLNMPLSAPESTSYRRELALQGGVSPLWVVLSMSIYLFSDMILMFFFM